MFKREGKYFSLIFVSIIVAIIATVLFSTFLLLLNFESINTSMTNKYMKKELYQISYSANYLQNSVKSFGMQLFMDPDVMDIMYSDNVDNSSLINVTNRINIYRTATPFIESLYIYNGKNNEFFSFPYCPNSGKGFFDSDIAAIIKNAKNNKALVPYERKLKYPFDSTPTNIYSYVLNDLKTKENGMYGALVLNVKEGWLSDIIMSLNTDPSNNVFIINDKGEIVCHSQSQMFGENQAGQEFIEKILTTDIKSGYFVDKVNTTESLISFSSSDDLGWKFISVIPYSVVIRDINAMRVKAIVICLVIILLCIILSFLISKKLYKPVKKLVADFLKNPEKTKDMKRLDEFQLISGAFLKIEEQVKELNTINRDYMEVGKNKTLIGLLNGEHLDTGSASGKKIKDIKLNIDLTGEYKLILFRIDSYNRFMAEKDYESRSLMRFAIGNICSEILQASFKVEAAENGQDQIILILNGSDLSKDETNEAIGEHVKMIQQASLQYLKISLSVAISSVAGDINELCLLYSEITDMSTYRIKYGHQCILTPEILRNVRYEVFSYPTEKERQLTECIMLGDLEKTKEIYRDILSQCIDHPYSTINLCVMRMAFAINNTFIAMERNSSAGNLADFNSFIKEIANMETLDQINDSFEKLFSDIISNMKNNKSNKHSALVKTIIEKCEQYYYDKDLSITQIADEMKMSPAYLTRIFKEHTIKSIFEYINDIRLKKAKELLAGTDLTVNEISDKVGYMSSKYFYTFFKKNTGVTPIEFRKNNQ